MNTDFLYGSHGAIILTNEQTQQLKNWLLENTQLTTEDFKKNSFEVKLNDEISDVLGFNEKGVTFGFGDDEYWITQDKIWGLDKTVFERVIKEQEWEKSEFGLFSNPKDVYNHIVDKTIAHPDNQKWFESKKDWQERIYTADRLTTLLTAAAGAATVKGMLTGFVIGLGKNQTPITLQGFIEYLGKDHPYSLQIMDILNKWETDNISKFKIIDQFIHMVVSAKLAAEGKIQYNHSMLEKDFEGDELTPNILSGYHITPEGDKVDIRDIPDAIEELNGITWQDKQKARLEVEAQSERK